MPTIPKTNLARLAAYQAGERSYSRGKFCEHCQTDSRRVSNDACIKCHHLYYIHHRDATHSHVARIKPQGKKTNLKIHKNGGFVTPEPKRRPSRLPRGAWIALTHDEGRRARSNYLDSQLLNGRTLSSTAPPPKPHYKKRIGAFHHGQKL
jgi:hypothetical protein